MAKAGRKRKSGARHPSGDIIREVDLAPMKVKRLRDAALVGMQDARWATQAGRLYLVGRLSESEYEAGCRWAGLASRNAAASVSGGSMSSPSDFNRSSGFSADPESEVGVMEAKRHLMDMDRYQKALVVVARHGSVARGAIEALFERNESIAYEEFLKAVCGLKSLAEHFRLTSVGKSLPVGK